MTLRLEGTILTGRSLGPGAVDIGADGLLTHAARPRRTVRLPHGWIVAPGFVDVQVNGYAGAEVGGDPAALAHIALVLPATGVTAFCPTLVTRDAAGYRAAAAALAAVPAGAPGARILRPHLEGPFLNPARAGAHRAELTAGPTPEAVDALAGLLYPAIVTLAPELDGAPEAVARLALRGAVVAVGHTEADAACARAAIDAGARMLTHAFNAMRGLEHRAPSALAVFLAHPAVHVGLIGDGVHVAPEVAAVAARAAGSRLVLVSDATSPAGAPPGDHLLAGRPVRSDGRRVTTAGGRLAGAAVGVDAGPRTLTGAGVDVAGALAAAAVAPRELLGLPVPPAPGAPADLVVLDGDLVPRLTLVGGCTVHAHPDLPFDPPAGDRA